jgi:hypothetical protein
LLLVLEALDPECLPVELGLVSASFVVTDQPAILYRVCTPVWNKANRRKIDDKNSILKLVRNNPVAPIVAGANG